MLMIMRKVIYFSRHLPATIRQAHRSSVKQTRLTMERLIQTRSVIWLYHLPPVVRDPGINLISICKRKQLTMFPILVKQVASDRLISAHRVSLRLPFTEILARVKNFHKASWVIARWLSREQDMSRVPNLPSLKINQQLLCKLKMTRPKLIEP